MSAAADCLRVSQPAISASIRQLEQTLNAQLIIRRPGPRLRLTTAGRAFLGEARPLLSHAQDAARIVADLAGVVSGALTVGCFRSEAPFLLPGLLATFSARFPKVELGFIEGSAEELTTALLQGACELAISYDVGLSADLESSTLYEQVPHVVVAENDPAAHLPSIALSELAERDMIMFDLPPTQAYLDTLFASVASEPRVRYRTTSYELVRALVGRGLGYTLLINRPPGDASCEGRPLVTVPLANAPPRISVVLAQVRGTRLTARGKAFAQHCNDVLPFPRNPAQ
jgi:DNA-binding transcriptional LysR family regulator